MKWCYILKNILIIVEVRVDMLSVLSEISLISRSPHITPTQQVSTLSQNFAHSSIRSALFAKLISENTRNSDFTRYQTVPETGGGMVNVLTESVSDPTIFLAWRERTARISTSVQLPCDARAQSRRRHSSFIILLSLSPYLAIIYSIASLRRKYKGK